MDLGHQQASRGHDAGVGCTKTFDTVYKVTLEGRWRSGVAKVRGHQMHFTGVTECPPAQITRATTEALRNCNGQNGKTN